MGSCRIWGPWQKHSCMLPNCQHQEYMHPYCTGCPCMRQSSQLLPGWSWEDRKKSIFANHFFFSSVIILNDFLKFSFWIDSTRFKPVFFIRATLGLGGRQLLGTYALPLNISMAAVSEGQVKCCPWGARIKDHSQPENGIEEILMINCSDLRYM